MVRFKPIHLAVDWAANAAYLYLPGHPPRGKDSVGCVVQTLILEDLIPGYQGPGVSLDFDKEGVLIGIDLGRAAMVALAGMGRGLHLAQEGVHFLGVEAASGAAG